MSKSMAYLRLLRIPNVFTAVADVMMGFLITHPAYAPLPLFVLLACASCALYLAGMVLNDVFDVDVDAVERTQRPIPSGAISRRRAAAIGGGLLAIGVVMACIAAAINSSWQPALIAVLLALCIVLYDGVLKRTPLAPVVMGGCRSLNVLLGMSVAVESTTMQLRALTTVEWTIAAGIGVYITGVTWFARTEVRISERAQLLGGMVVILSGLGLLSAVPEWRPLVVDNTSWYCLWGVIGLITGIRCFRAVADPSPQHVQAAVKHCILSIIVLDAAVTAGLRGVADGAIILCLLIPMWLLGRWVYST